MVEKSGPHHPWSCQARLLPIKLANSGKASSKKKARLSHTPSFWLMERQSQTKNVVNLVWFVASGLLQTCFETDVFFIIPGSKEKRSMACVFLLWSKCGWEYLNKNGFFRPKQNSKRTQHQHYQKYRKPHHRDASSFWLTKVHSSNVLAT